MAKARGMAPEQLRTLDRLKQLPGIERFYLAGASAIAWHLRHRRSLDLDLFSKSESVSLDSLRLALRGSRAIKVVDATDTVLALKVGDVPVDIVRYPYPPLEAPAPGPHGFPVAGLHDLAAMKLAAIARRGIQRDFWDLYEICRRRLTLAEAARSYRERFGSTDADLYHVQRALTWFEDAERDPRKPEGLTPELWERIKTWFRREAPALLESPKPARRR